MTPFRRTGIGLALLSLAGCGDLPIYTVSYQETYRPGETQSSGPDVPVVVRGNTYDVPKPEFDSAVAEAMQGWSSWPDHFTIAGNPNAAYRVIVVFNPTSSVGPETYCARPLVVDGASGPVPSERVPITMTLCRGTTYLSTAEGRVTLTGGPRGGVFRNAVGQTTHLLFPGQVPPAGGPDCGNC